MLKSADDPFHVGDKVSVWYGGGFGDFNIPDKILFIAAISDKSGRITLEGGYTDKFRSDGRKVGGDKWDRTYITHWRQADSDETTRCNLAHKVAGQLEKLRPRTMTAANLEELLAVLQKYLPPDPKAPA